MPAQKLKNFLDSHHIKYVTINHSRAYTAQTIAESAHIRAREMAKTVICKIDDGLAMAVLPASHQLDLEALKQAAGAKEIELASEAEFRNLFPDCELGAMPPFGNLYDMDVYAAKKLAENDEIAFNAGSHTELVRMSYSDFENLVRPKVLALT